MRKLSLLAAVVMMSSILLVSCAKPEQITLKEYDKIKDGMTYEQVVEIIGSEGKVASEAGDKGTELYSVVYQFEGSGGPGSNATISFSGSPLKLEDKAQAGLK